MNKSKIDEILQALNYSKNALDSITVSGASNCQKLAMVYNNIDVFLNMLNKGEICIVENQPNEDSKEN